jgi:hypothetical protein
MRSPNYAEVVLMAGEPEGFNEAATMRSPSFVPWLWGTLYKIWLQ